MKAAYIQQFGGPEVLKYGDLPDPTPGPGQIVVDTVAASNVISSSRRRQTACPTMVSSNSIEVSAIGRCIQ